GQHHARGPARRRQPVSRHLQRHRPHHRGVHRPRPVEGAHLDPRRRDPRSRAGDADEGGAQPACRRPGRLRPRDPQTPPADDARRLRRRGRRAHAAQGAGVHVDEPSRARHGRRAVRARAADRRGGRPSIWPARDGL
ncbi:MAG: hypothetical protein AVDCRST_MAG67-1455, partial [uncultured Solirubrobacteraceae bacterium]